jgi:hypothetical protein
MNGEQSVQGRADQDSIFGDCALDHLNDFVDRRIEVERLASCRRFLDVIAHAINNPFGPIGIPDDAGKRFSDLGEIWRAQFQKTHARTSVVTRRGDGMEDFVS